MSCFLSFDLKCIGFLHQVDTAGWLERTKQEKGPSSLSVVQSRKHLMRAHVVALVLDAEEVCRRFIIIYLTRDIKHIFTTSPVHCNGC